MAVFAWLRGGPDEPQLVALHAAADALLAFSFFAIPLAILWVLRHRLDLFRSHRTLAVLFCAFILCSGFLHVTELVENWMPIFGFQGLIKTLTAAIAVATMVFMWPLLPGLAHFSSDLKQINDRLRREVGAHEATLRELEAAHGELENRVAERTQELSLVNARFETALRGAEVYVFSQDRDLRYTWIYSPRGEEAAAAMIGRSDDEIAGSSPELGAVAAAKRRVLASGKAEDCEVSAIMPDRRALFALHVDPTFGSDGKPDGIMCAAIDISRIRSLESEQRRLTEELGAALQRYETALRGSNVTVYTQDRDLRYISVSRAMFGLDPEQILGRTDADILPADTLPGLAEIKREVLEQGQPRDTELRIEDAGYIHWYDFHIEPLRDVTGAIVGLTCAAVDVTAAKEGESHLRLLLREISHRSKNLLAVIQAMARQTGRHAGDIDIFLEQFSARVQALARAHDLLVQESWHGASLPDLVRTQLAHYLDGGASQISVGGPGALLKPEAAQSLGLALHELAVNAAKYGALSVPKGHVDIYWRRMPSAAGDAIEILWTESGGPPVTQPEKRGFGCLVIERNLARSIDCDVDLTFPPAGLRCRVLIPPSHITVN